MKKSVIVLIGVIYVMAIAVVSFFGLKIDTLNEVIYVEKIECTNEELKTTSDGTKYISVKYIADDLNPTTVQLEWHVYPDEASRKGVEFIYDEERNIADVSPFGTVIFKRKGAVTIYITTTDGSAISEVVKVIAY